MGIAKENIQRQYIMQLFLLADLRDGRMGLTRVISGPLSYLGLNVPNKKVPSIPVGVVILSWLY